METVLQILEKSAQWLDRRGVPQPRLDAEWILAHELGCGRLELYLQFERPLEAERLERLRDSMRRRASREPLQYILGSVDFAGIRLQTDSRALIPRPETEELVAEVIERFRGRPPGRVADLGSGSGAIALALAHAWKESEVWATEANRESLKLAWENARALDLESRLTFRVGSWCEPLEGRFDLILANPPYLSEAEWAEAEPEVRDWEPRQALVGDAAGRADLDRIVTDARGHLRPGGTLVLETGIDHHAGLRRLAGECGWIDFESRRDFSGRDRFAWLRAPAEDGGA